MVDCDVISYRKVFCVPGASSLTTIELPIQPAHKRKFSLLEQHNQDRRTLVLVLLLGLLFLVSGLAAFPLVNPSECYYAEGAREMFLSGNFIVPTLNFQPWFDKPILIYWCISAAYSLFGISEFSARFPSALAATLLVASLFLSVKALARRRTALCASLILLSSPFFLVAGHLALTDMLLCATVSGAMLAFAQALLLKRRGYSILAFALLGLAMLTKGPVAPGLAGIAILSYLLVSSASPRAFWQQVRLLHPVLGTLVFCAIALPWYAAVHYETAGTFTREFFFTQNLARMNGELPVHHNANIFTYLPVILGGFFPWIVSLIWLPPMAAKAYKQRFQGSQRQKLLLFALVWAGSMFTVLSLLPTKLPTYCLPVLPPLAIVAAVCLGPHLRQRKALPFAVYAISMCAIGVTALAIGTITGLASHYQAAILPIITGVAGFACVPVLLRRGQERQAILFSGFVTVILVAVLVPLFMIGWSQHKQADLQRMISRACEDNASVIGYKVFLPAYCFASGQKMVVVKSDQDLDKELMARPDPRYIFICTGDLKSLKQGQYKLTPVLKSKRWSLLRVSVDN